ncbi:uncharacterized protein LOC130692275 isoform X2 [Daphnia carinata]|uniref:uncharacterized protein LOC130692275 isoform X2 n=1 Tax=Daphnia carinata TaxID=120202 RepID=UPI0028690AB2|nr:uncharacterized protein LOC130692275 isoform X2 [Daphnia carinata]
MDMEQPVGAVLLSKSVVTVKFREKMNSVQIMLVTMAVLSVHVVNANRDRRAPQFYPYNPYSIANDIHNQIAGLTYQINNRVVAAANAAVANTFAAATQGLNGATGTRYPTNGGNGFGSGGSAVAVSSGGNRFTSGGNAVAAIGSSGIRPSSTSLRPSSFRPTTIPVRQQTSFRPSSGSARPVSVAVGSPNRFAAAGAGPLPGGGVSASAGAISISG